MHHTENKEFPQRHYCIHNKRTSTSCSSFLSQNTMMLGVCWPQQIRLPFVFEHTKIHFGFVRCLSRSLANSDFFRSIWCSVICCCCCCLSMFLRSPSHWSRCAWAQRNVWAVNILTPGHFNKITFKNYKRHFFSSLFPFYSNYIRLFDSSFLYLALDVTSVELHIVYK